MLFHQISMIQQSIFGSHVVVTIIGPIPWGHSVVVIVVVDINAQAACDSTASDIC